MKEGFKNAQMNKLSSSNQN